jgi:CRP-like cAMP-binding protein
VGYAGGRRRLTVLRPDGSRPASLSVGMVVGELGAAGRARRSAEVVAETPVECHALPWERPRRLGETHPSVHAAVLEVLGRAARADRAAARARVGLGRAAPPRSGEAGLDSTA